ncbi:MAG: MFS transporter [Treponema sp.]|jgi:MFS family permease|nr:MFS transporter [Treponema sp.]
MRSNTDFHKKTIPIFILGILLMYFYSGLQTDHLNVLTPYYRKLGWMTTTITNPVTWAGFVIIPATLLVGTLLIKFGIPQVLVTSMIIVGCSVLGLSCAGQNLILYSISLFCIRLFILPMQMGTFMLCTNWFVKKRGKALGIVTTGSPLCTATFIYLLSRGTAGIGFHRTYLLVGIIVLVLAGCVAIFIKSKPEDTGLHPDGDTYTTELESENMNLSVKDVFKHREAWLLVVSYGFLQFCIVGIMSFYVVRLNMTGTSPKLYFFWLSIAALLGIPVSFLFGVVDDKFGTISASLLLCATFILTLFGLLFMRGNNGGLLLATAVGIAGVTGGTPTLHPSITSYVYGRRCYQAANRWIMTFQAVLMAFAIYFMSSILDKTGTLAPAYIIMIGLVIIAVICLIIIGHRPDHDRAALKNCR